MVANFFRGPLLAISLSGLLFSAASVAEDLNIAVLDTQRALVESEEAKTLVEKINRELKQEEADAKKLNDEIRAMQEKLSKDGEVMSASEKRKTTKSIEDKQIDLQFMVNKLQKELNDRRQELLQQMVPKVDAVLKDLIELEGYDFILERGSLRYANPKHDITRKVTEKLNSKK